MQIEKIRDRIRGIALTTVTPLKDDGAVDADGIYRLVEFFTENGLNRKNTFLVPLSTTGNFLALSLQEKKQVAETFLKAAGEVFPVVVGCNHTRMAEIIELARFSQDRGALAIMVCPPFYWKATDEQIVAHYDEICSAIDIGVIVYNNHWASQVDLSVDTLDRILDNDNIIGLKESTHSIFKAVQVHRRFKDRLNIFNGLGEAHEPMFTHLGSRGFTSVLGNAVPQTTARLHHLLGNRRFDEARQLAGDITPLADYMDARSGGQYIAALKYALHRKGVCGQTERKPVVALAPERHPRAGSSPLARVACVTQSRCRNR